MRLRNIQLYIDIDGVLVRSRFLRPPFDKSMEVAPYAFDFLVWAVSLYDCHWLSTRDADGSHDGILRAFKYALSVPVLPDPVIRLICAVRPTLWNACKSSALPFGTDFLWLDDNPSSLDLLELDRQGCRDRWIEVNTDVKPDDLLRARQVIESWGG
jgi:hypothetical protein